MIADSKQLLNYTMIIKIFCDLQFENLPGEQHKTIANRIEEIIKNDEPVLFSKHSHFNDYESLVKQYAQEIIKDKLVYPSSNQYIKISRSITKNTKAINLASCLPFFRVAVNLLFMIFPTCILPIKMKIIINLIADALSESKLIAN